MLLQGWLIWCCLPHTRTIIREAEPYGRGTALVIQPTYIAIYSSATPLLKPATFRFISSPLRSLGAGPCHSGIERTLLRKVIGRELDLWRFP